MGAKPGMYTEKELGELRKRPEAGAWYLWCEYRGVWESRLLRASPECSVGVHLSRSKGGPFTEKRLEWGYRTSFADPSPFVSPFIGG